MSRLWLKSDILSYDYVSLNKTEKENRQVNSKKEKLGQDGIKLSGGQIQRIGIARCLYKDPELLIFDEATSSLDIDSERKILSLIKKISKSKTLIMCKVTSLK